MTNHRREGNNIKNRPYIHIYILEINIWMQLGCGIFLSDTYWEAIHFPTHTKTHLLNKCCFSKTTSWKLTDRWRTFGQDTPVVDGHIEACWHWTGDLFVSIYVIQKNAGPTWQPWIFLGCTELACLVTFNHLPRDACLALSSAFYKVPQSQAVHKQVGIIIKYDY